MSDIPTATQRCDRRRWLQSAMAAGALAWTANRCQANANISLAANAAKVREARWDSNIHNGLEYLAKTQSSRGQWNTPPYPTAIAALAGTAMLCSGSTTTQGPYAKQIGRTTDFFAQQVSTQRIDR